MNKIIRPWGHMVQYTLNKLSTTKILAVEPKQRISLQYHNHRDEIWVFLDNNAVVTVGNKHYRPKAGTSLFIQKKERHRLGAVNGVCKVLEIAFGNFDESDIVRIEDDYNRK